MRLLSSKQHVRFLVDPKPSGDLYTRRHDRRVTPYPHQIQALIDADLLTAGCYEAHRDRRWAESDARDAEIERLMLEDRPHVLRQMWEHLKHALGCV